MKSRLHVVLYFAILFSPIACNNNEEISNKYIVTKENGKIILAYNAFEDFLDSDRSWESYKTILLDAYPQVQVVHNRQLGWGAIDSIKFREDIKNYKREDFEHLFTQYSNETLHYLYDSIIELSHTILAPSSKKQVDLCFFLPYGSCFVLPEDGRNTIYIHVD